MTTTAVQTAQHTSLHTMDTEKIMAKFKHHKLWQWCLDVNGSFFDINNIDRLFPEWDTDENGNHKSFAHMINTYGPDIGITRVGFCVGYIIKWFDSSKEDNFKVCLRYRQEIFSGSVNVSAVISIGNLSSEVFIGGK